MTVTTSTDKPTIRTRREFMQILGWGTVSITLASITKCSWLPNRDKPLNVIIIYCDDLGYGDLGTFGHPTIRTPNLDQMSREGQKWTNFYSAASVCTPSRAALLTGRLPIRSGMCSDVRRVLFPDSAGGLPQSEITIAKALKAKQYATACIGKWHLGHLPPFLPTHHGFDYYFGIPYSNDMDWFGEKVPHPFRHPKIEYWNVPLMRNEEIIERPADQRTITKRYTEESMDFIRKNKDKPFFLYLAHNMPHVPLFASKDFLNRSLRGLYGDVVEEIDRGVGQILAVLREEGLAENTLVVFSSDNGPWVKFRQQGGSAGLLRGGKGATFEGGMRVPTLFWWPGKTSPGIITDMGSTLDLFTTICHLAGVDIPQDRTIDGLDLSSPLLGQGPSPRNVMFFYRGRKLYAVRKGPFKAHFFTKPAYGGDLVETQHDPPLLFHLEHDPSEKFDIAKDHPDVIEDLLQEVERHKDSLGEGEDRLEKRIMTKPPI